MCQEMPEFLDLFVSQVCAKRERLVSVLSFGRRSVFEEEFRSLLRNSWNPLPGMESGFSKVVGVDGSRALRLYVVGGVLYVVRAAGVYGKQRIRELEVDAFTSASSSRDINRFVNRKMEWLEHRAALHALEKFDDVECVLIDGTLHGRMMAVPRDSAAEGQKAFMLQYFQDYTAFLEECRRRSIVPIGVSKDSRSTHLKTYFLSLILENYFDELNTDSLQREKLLSMLFEMVDEEVRKQFTMNSVVLENVFREAASSVTDHQIICNYAEEAGFTQPLEIGVYGRGARLVRQFIESPIHYIHRNFPEAFEEAGDRASFLEWGGRVLSKIPSLPTIVSFHILLDRRDSPLRIDVPSWFFGLDNTLSNKMGVSPVNVRADLLEKVVATLMRGYGGLRNYNVWLVQADKEVKLSRETVDTLYHRSLEKFLGLGTLLTPVRRERRVRFP